MRKRFILSTGIVLLLLVATAGIAYAQTYYFQVARETADLYINADGTASITYQYDFANSTAADPIEYVDVGLPNDNYDIGSVTASVNGLPITDIETADPQYIVDGDSGITLGLGDNAIQPGQNGTVLLTIGRIEKMLYPGEDQSRPNYASFQFSPNYFGSDYVTGNTDITVTIHLPAGVQPEESVYYPASGAWSAQADPVSGFDDQGNIYFSWHDPNGRADNRYIFGGGFPDHYVPAAAIVHPPLIDPDLLICLGVTLLIVVVVGFSIFASARSANKRKLAYLPPKISIEGHGIKRGLTAVEAAIVMEQSLDKVMTMILFGLVKKGTVSVTKRDPLTLEITRPLPTDLHPYETQFVEAFDKPKDSQRRKELQEMFVTLVRSVSEKMKGFSRKETVDYYESIVKRAWEQVEAADTPEVKSKAYDDTLEWTLMDKRYAERTQTVFSQGPVFVPTWWGRYDPVYRGSFGSAPGPAAPARSSSGGSTPSMPHLPGSDFAASVVGGVQSFGAGVIGELTSFTSGITNVTNPVPKTTYTSSSHGGGGSSGGCACACACACAGCACACAGGGR